jgi:hypothetical protein
MNDRKATVCVVLLDEKTTLWHTRKGLIEDETQATKFKTLEHALKLCRKKYTPMLGVTLKQWKASDCDQS